VTVAVFPGTFDPITNGHVDVAVRASRLFERLIVAVSVGEMGRKQSLFPVEERIALVRESLAHLPNVVVDSYEGLTVHYAIRMGGHVLVRGLRAVSDFEYELGLANVNHDLDETIETVCLMTTAPHSYIHSSLVREAAMLGGDVHKLVPPHVYRALQRKLGRE